MLRRLLCAGVLALLPLSTAQASSITLTAAESDTGVGLYATVSNLPFYSCNQAVAVADGRVPDASDIVQTVPLYQAFASASLTFQGTYRLTGGAPGAGRAIELWRRDWNPRTRKFFGKLRPVAGPVTVGPSGGFRFRFRGDQRAGMYLAVHRADETTDCWWSNPVFVDAAPLPGVQSRRSGSNVTITASISRVSYRPGMGKVVLYRRVSKASKRGPETGVKRLVPCSGAAPLKAFNRKGRAAFALRFCKYGTFPARLLFRAAPDSGYVDSWIDFTLVVPPPPPPSSSGGGGGSSSPAPVQAPEPVTTQPSTGAVSDDCRSIACAQSTGRLSRLIDPVALGEALRRS